MLLTVAVLDTCADATALPAANRTARPDTGDLVTPPSVFHRYAWTDRSLQRNRLSRKYEPLQPFIMLEFLEAFAPEVFVDVGANIGLYSVLLGSHAGIRDLHCFEPVPEAHDELRANIDANGLTPKASVHRVALSDAAGSTSMSIIGALSGANAISSTSIHRDKAAIERIKVPLARLDDILNISGRTILMKVDVEGHETAVLRGAEKLLSENHGIIQVELYNESAGTEEAESTLARLGWQTVFRAGPDRYVSNISELFNPGRVREIIEKSVARLIEDNLLPDLRPKPTPVRRRVLPGVTLEFSDTLSFWLRQRLSRR